MIKNALLILLVFSSLLYSQQFTQMTNQPPVTFGSDSRSVNWVDYDNDGDLDLFITNGLQAGQNNLLFEIACIQAVKFNVWQCIGPGFSDSC